jgi:hypothetical protein
MRALSRRKRKQKKKKERRKGKEEKKKRGGPSESFVATVYILSCAVRPFVVS